jgi:hypothetical protein
MTSGVYLSTASVAAILAGVALLAVLSAFTVAPFGRYGRRRYIVAFLVCLVAIWAGAVLIIVLIRPTT